MSNKKITTKQRKAISRLVCDLDELRNKPRRLFSALRTFASEFMPDKVQEEHLNEILDDIDEFEQFYYKKYDIDRLLTLVAEEIREVKKEATSRNRTMPSETLSDDYLRGCVNGAEFAAQKMTERIINMIVRELYN